MDNELLVKSIRGLCKKNGISVSQLESELNFGAGLISRWSKNSPSIDKIVSIADRFGVSIDETIGRTLSLKSKTTDSFIDKLYNMTTTNSIIWEDETDNVPNMQENDNCSIEDDGYKYFELYTTKYNNGIVYLYAQYDKEKGIIDDIDIQLYIQPSKKTVLVIQECDEAKSYDLWYYIQAKFNGDLDEIQAEEFKNDFVNEKNNSLEQFKNNPKALKEIYNQVISIDPEIADIIAKLNTPEVQKLQQMFSDPNFRVLAEQASKIADYFKDISI